MQQLNNCDLAWCVNRLPKAIRKLLKDEPARAVLAGGYIRSRICGEKPNDIDLFAPNPDAAEAYARRLSDGDEPYKTDNAFTVRGSLPVQVIHRWTYNTPNQVVESFDFTIAKAAIWYDGEHWQSLIADTFYADLAGRRLIYTSPIRNEDAGGSMLRVLKFYQRGYRIPLESLGAVVARLTLGVDPAVLSRRDEDHAAKVLSGLLREVDPSIDPEHIAH